ncbi:UDP-glycosyltransferase 85A5-like [Pyrus ussuriensis x Pyrus communis]|uniref:UDP-glycosyltransferase 85A5-like n=1 Tax=Pyrus ussuriensis x Pyrus communis TaxID=2448454 RepID=A0A5N5G2G9_9ROSA|nr:UDP-glycosyltransferase 85A5-like [Pyrus ussuriensis x Pyrus communis]
MWNESFQGVRWNENSPKTRPVEQLVPPILGAPNVGRNALSHSVPSRPTYQTVRNPMYLREMLRNSLE